MSILSLGTVAVLLALALVHLLWAHRIWWPVEQEADLARMVVGAKGRDTMPGAGACYAVATALAGVAALALALGGVLPFGGPVVRLLLGLAAAVFLLRGLAAYSGPWARLTPEPGFRSLDRMVYGPLCLAIGINLMQMVASSG